MSRHPSRSALLALVALLGGCFAAAAGAGAGAAYYFTTRGVGSTIGAPVDDVAARTESVFAAQGIRITETKAEPGADKRTLKGKKGDLDIEVQIERQSDQTSKAEVSAQKNLVEWDKDYAQSLMDKIVHSTVTARR
jgi:hypothetical protein